MSNYHKQTNILLTCTKFSYHPEVLTCLIPFMKAYNIWMVHIVTESYLTKKKKKSRTEGPRLSITKPYHH